MMPAGQASDALPFAVPARFLFTGAAALVVAWTSLAWSPAAALGYHATPRVLAQVHLLTLGLGVSVLVGAMHQLVPVMLVTRLYAPTLGLGTYLLTTAGAAGVVLGFALGGRAVWLAAGGTLAWLGVAMFAYNLVRTARRAHRLDTPGIAMLISAGSLLLTLTVGIAIALTRWVPAWAGALGHLTPLHVALGLIGTFGVAIAGAGHKLLAMFTLSHGANAWPLRAFLALVGTGVALTAWATWAPAGWGGAGPASTWTVAVARGAFVLAAVTLIADVAGILRRRLRRRPDVGVATFLLGVAGVIPAALLWLAGRPVEAAATVLLGAVSLAVAGMLVKIVSFLAWQHRYAPRIGKGGEPPMLADMILPAAGWVTAAGLAAGTAGLVIARLTGSAPLAGTAAGAGMLGAWTLLIHVAWIAFGRHAPRPRVRAGAGPEVSHAG